MSDSFELENRPDSIQITWCRSSGTVLTPTHFAYVIYGRIGAWVENGTKEKIELTAGETEDGVIIKSEN